MLFLHQIAVLQLIEVKKKRINFRVFGSKYFMNMFLMDLRNESFNLRHGKIMFK
jgi:hypothetical protein